MSGKNESSGDKNLCCSFCGKTQHEVRKLIAGPNVFICDECIELCNDIVKDESLDGNASSQEQKLPKPMEIRQTLDDYVIGQEVAKKSSRWRYITTTNAWSTVVAAPTWHSTKATSCSLAPRVRARPCSHRLWRVC